MKMSVTNRRLIRALLGITFPCGLMCFYISCSKIGLQDETDEYISFGKPLISVDVETRSIAKDALEAGEVFGALGYCVPNQLGTQNPDYSGGQSVWSTKYRVCPPSVFYKERITVSDDGGYCSYPNPKQWYREGRDLTGNSNSSIPAEADLFRYTFFAYYPYDNEFSIDSPNSATSIGAPKITFTMPQEDNSLDHSKTPDAMFGVLYNRQKSQGSLTFSFSHLLTALGFEVNNFSNQELEIHSIKLSGSFFKKIVLDFSKDGTLSRNDNDMFPDEYYTGEYVLYDEYQNGGQPLVLSPPSENVDKTTSGLLPKNGNGEGEHILLISGKEPYFGDGVNISVDYTFGGVRSEPPFSSSRPETFIPQPGVKYTAQLNFVGDAFVLQFVVDNSESWQNGGSDDPNPDDDSEYNDKVVFE